MDGECAEGLTMTMSMSKDRHHDTTKDTIAQHLMSLRFIQGVLYHWQRQAVANGLVPHTALRDLRALLRPLAADAVLAKGINKFDTPSKMATLGIANA